MRIFRLASVLMLVAVTACGSEAGSGVEQPPEAGFSGGKPVGLFFMTRFWSATNSLEKAVWYFAPDGRVYQNLEAGFSEADLEAHAGNQGTYEVNGDEMQVTWADGSTTQSTMERDGTGFSWDAGIFTAVEPFEDDESVAGTYEGGESFSVGGSGASVSKTLRLDPDGTFAWDGVGFVASETGESRLTAGGESGTTGTWQVSGYSLLLTDANGNVVRGIAFPYDDEETPVYPDRMFFGGTMYERR